MLSRRWILWAVFAAVAAAQSSSPPPASPEIRGIVLDPDTKQPVAFTEISLYFVGDEQPRIITGLGTMTASEKAVTDLSGEFAFHPDKVGHYAIAAKRDGYNAPGGNNSGMSNTKRFSLTKDAPVQEVKLYLSKPGRLTGIVTDEDTHKPLANVKLGARAPRTAGSQVFGAFGGGVASGPDGKFTIENVRAGQYIVEINRQKSGEDRMLAKFTEDDLKAVDEDLEHSFWPGGHDEASAIPVTVSSGGSADVGVLRVRTVKYYRLHVKMLPSTCASGDTMQVYEQIPGSMLTISQSAGCKEDFVVTGFAPGAYQLLLAVNKRTTATREMAAIPFTIGDKNVDVSASLARGMTLDLHFVAADGAKTPDWTNWSIMAYSWDMLPFADVLAEHKPDADDKTRLVGLPQGRLDISVSGMSAGNDITVMLYNGSALEGRRLVLDPNAIAHSLTIVVDDKPASIYGTVTKGDDKAIKPYVVLFKLPLAPEQSFPSRFPTATGDDKGQFQFSGLAPGKYYVAAVPTQADFDSHSTIAVQRLLEKAHEVEVGPGGSMSVQVEVLLPR